MRSQLARVWTDSKLDGDAMDETKIHVLRSASCLFVQLQPLWSSRSAQSDISAGRTSSGSTQLHKVRSRPPPLAQLQLDVDHAVVEGDEALLDAYGGILGGARGEHSDGAESVGRQRVPLLQRAVPLRL